MNPYCDGSDRRCLRGSERRATRRQVLAGALVTVSTTVAGCLSFGSDVDDDAADAGTDDADDATRNAEDGELPFEVRILAPEADAGETLSIPNPGVVTVCNFTRTYCPSSAAFVDDLADYREAFPTVDVRLVSVFDELRALGDDVDDDLEWWSDTGADWYLAYDGTGAVVSYFDVAIPGVTVVDGEGTIHLSTDHGASQSEIVSAIEQAQ